MYSIYKILKPLYNNKIDLFAQCRKIKQLSLDVAQYNENRNKKQKDPVKIAMDVSRQSVSFYNECADKYGFDRI